MSVVTRRKLPSKRLIVLLSVVVLGGLLLINAGGNPLAKGTAVWAAGSFGARPGVGTSAGAGGGAVGVGVGAPGPGVAGYPVAYPREYVH